MARSKDKLSLPLQAACAAVAESLPKSEYLTDRHGIFKGKAYMDVSVTAKWLPEFETISVALVFLVSSNQKAPMQTHIDNDETRDDIDSGLGELFEAELQRRFPDYDWGCSIGEVKIKCESMK